MSEGRAGEGTGISAVVAFAATVIHVHLAVGVLGPPEQTSKDFMPTIFF